MIVKYVVSLTHLSSSYNRRLKGNHNARLTWATDNKMLVNVHCKLSYDNLLSEFNWIFIIHDYVMYACPIPNLIHNASALDHPDYYNQFSL